MTSRIFIKGLCVYGYHGCRKEEASLGQRFFIDLNIEADISEAEKEDRLEKSVCYARVAKIAEEISTTRRFDLIEALAGTIGEALLAEYVIIKSVDVTIRKPSAPVSSVFEHVGVSVIRRRKIEFALSLGSNIGNRAQHLRNAVRFLCQEEGISINAVSHLYQTDAWGKKDQDDFLNLCATGTTELSAQNLLHRCLNIEKMLGRTRDIHWGPRIIDIDILFYGNVEIRSEQLNLPHPEMMKRAFVLVPLLELLPDGRLGNQNITEALKALGSERDGVTIVKDL